jgi:Xaa-Pro aminopeptidase
LREQLAVRGLDAAIIADRRHVHYFTGAWWRDLYAPILLVERDEPAVLVAPLAPASLVAADHVIVYASQRLGTLVDDQVGAALEAIAPRLAGRHLVGCDVPIRLQGPRLECVDLSDVMRALRRTKADDEIALLEVAIGAAETAYERVRHLVRPGVSEVDVFAAVQAAAAAYVGEPIGEIGNDFQIGSTGSAPRRRAARTGEVAILDISIVVRGYAGDMCRSLVVGGRASPEQEAARDRVLEVLAHIENTARPGVSCRSLFETARAMLDGYRGWAFRHHLGHGIGLCNHEAPRLNPHWDDRLEVGDVIAVEPALYGDDLKAGIRIEEIYHVAASGLKKLTSFPTELTWKERGA